MRAGAVIGVTGHMGAGKGLTLQLFSGMFRRAGLDVYANYDSRICTRRLENIPELLNCRRGLIVWDEIDLCLHARDFSKDLSIKLVKWLKMIRKQGLRLIWATQNPYYLDVNIRRVTHYLINCVRIELRGLPATRLDVYRVEAGGEMFVYKYSWRYVHTSGLYSSYDTLDARNVLSPDVGGLAVYPLSPDDFVHRSDKSGSNARAYAELQQRYIRLQQDFHLLQQQQQRSDVVEQSVLGGRRRLI